MHLKSRLKFHGNMFFCLDLRIQLIGGRKKVCFEQQFVCMQQLLLFVPLHLHFLAVVIIQIRLKVACGASLVRICLAAAAVFPCQYCVYCRFSDGMQFPGIMDQRDRERGKKVVDFYSWEENIALLFPGGFRKEEEEEEEKKMAALKKHILESANSLCCWSGKWQ